MRSVRRFKSDSEGVEAKFPTHIVGKGLTNPSDNHSMSIQSSSSPPLGQQMGDLFLLQEPGGRQEGYIEHIESFFLMGLRGDRARRTTDRGLAG